MRDLINILNEASIFTDSVYQPYMAEPVRQVFRPVGEIDGMTVAQSDAAEPFEQTLHLVVEGTSIGKIGMNAAYDLPVASSAFRVATIVFEQEHADKVLALYEWIAKNACDYVADDLDGDRWSAIAESDAFTIHRCDRTSLNPVSGLQELQEARQSGAAVIFSAAAEKGATAHAPARLVEGKLFDLKRLSGLA